jgi:rhodanese-related sulfurtransferase
MKKFTDLIRECLPQIQELFPWDLEERLAAEPAPLLLDVREPDEFAAMHIQGSINVPRGILEQACEYGYEETIPELASARGAEIVVTCRSGNRSALAAFVMQQLGYENVWSLKTGLRGWNEYEQPLVNAKGERVSVEVADEYFTPKLRPEQIRPAIPADS